MNLKFSISMLVFIEYDDATTSHCLRRYRVLQVLARGIKFLITPNGIKAVCRLANSLLHKTYSKVRATLAGRCKINNTTGMTQNRKAAQEKSMKISLFPLVMSFSATPSRANVTFVENSDAWRAWSDDTKKKLKKKSRVAQITRPSVENGLKKIKQKFDAEIVKKKEKKKKWNCVNCVTTHRNLCQCSSTYVKLCLCDQNLLIQWHFHSFYTGLEKSENINWKTKKGKIN